MTQAFDCFSFHTSLQFSKQSEVFLNQMLTKIFSKQKANHCFHCDTEKWISGKALPVIKEHPIFLTMTCNK